LRLFRPQERLERRVQERMEAIRQAEEEDQGEQPAPEHDEERP